MTVISFEFHENEKPKQFACIGMRAGRLGRRVWVHASARVSPCYSIQFNSLSFLHLYKYLFNTYYTHLWICERVQKPAEHYSLRSCNSRSFPGPFAKWSAPNSDSLKLDFFFQTTTNTHIQWNKTEKFYILHAVEMLFYPKRCGNVYMCIHTHTYT